MRRTRKGSEAVGAASLDDPHYAVVIDALADPEDPIQSAFARIYVRQVYQALRLHVTTHAPLWDELDWQIFRLRCAGEQNFACIARMLGRSVDTVKYRHRAHIQPAYVAMHEAQMCSRCGMHEKNRPEFNDSSATRDHIY